MNKKQCKILSFVIAGSLLLLSAFQMTFAASGSAFWNSLKGEPKKSKNVSIEVSTLHVKENGEVEKIPGLVRIGEGDDTSYIPIIKNIGKTCHLRMRLYAYAGDKKIDIPKYCYGFEKRWDKKDGWYYLKTPFAKNTEYAICDGFHFPKEWDYKDHNRLDVTIEAEAVQNENNVTPTGDNKEIYVYLIFSGIVIIALTVAVYQKRKQRN